MSRRDPRLYVEAFSLMGAIRAPFGPGLNQYADCWCPSTQSCTHLLQCPDKECDLEKSAQCPKRIMMGESIPGVS